MVKKLLNIVLMLVMVFGLLPGMGVKVHAEEKNLEPGGVYYLGETVTLGNGAWILIDDYPPAQITNKFMDGSFTLPATLTASDFNSLQAQWGFKVGDTYIYIGYEKEASADHIPTGFKCVNGDGTEYNPYEFELVYEAIPEYYLLWVGSTHVNGANAANITGSDPAAASYDPETNTLTLNGVTITAGHTDAEGLLHGICYEGSNALNIVLSSGSDNRIGNETTAFYDAIYSKTGDIIISEESAGAGLLTAYGTTGIASKNNLTINSGTVTVNGDSQGNGLYAESYLTVNGGTVTASGSNGLRALRGITISNGTVTANAGNNGIYSVADVTISGGSVTVSGNNNGICVGAEGAEGPVNIKDGVITASGSAGAAISGIVKNEIPGRGWTDAEGSGDGETFYAKPEGQTLSYKKVQFPAVIEYPVWVKGIQVRDDNKTNVLEDEGKTVSFDPKTNTLTLNGAAIATSDYGVSGIEAHGVNLTVTGSGTITNTCEDAHDEHCAGISILDGNLTMSEVSLTITSTADAGVFVQNGSFQFDSGNLTTSSTEDYGILVQTDGFNMKGGTVTSAGTAGISAKNITVSGGEVTATGTEFQGLTANEAISITDGTVTASAPDDDAAVQAVTGITIGDSLEIADPKGGKAIQTDVGWRILTSDDSPATHVVIKQKSAPATEYPVWVKGIQVTEDNKANVLDDEENIVSFDPKTNTLTLNNASISTADNYGAGIKATGIELTINGKGTINSDGSFGRGISVDGTGCKLTLSGDFTINSHSNYGVHVSGGPLEITDGTITINASNPAIYTNGGLTISGGTITAEGSYGIDADTVTVSGGTVNATGSKFNGIYATGAINISGGTVTASTESDTEGAVCADNAINIGGNMLITKPEGGAVIKSGDSYQIGKDGNIAEEAVIEPIPWTYTATADGDGITATRGTETAALTLTAEDKTYDGEPISAVLTPSDNWNTENGLPDPETVAIAYDKETRTDAGTYKAGITVNGVNAEKSFKINPKEVTLNWTETDVAYDGKEHPKAAAEGLVSDDDCTVTVEGAKSDAGTYTATAKSLSNPNYVLPKESTTEFTIRKTSQPAPETSDFTITDASSETASDGSISGAKDTMEYSTDNGETYKKVSGNKITSLKAGDVLIRYAEDKNHSASEPVTLTVKVADKTYAPVVPSVTWTKGSSSGTVFQFKGSRDDGETYDLFREVQVDGKAVVGANYTARSGSVVIEFKPAYLETLAEGTHTVKAVMDDGSAEATLIIKKQPSGKPSSGGSSGGSSKKPTTPADNVVTCQMAGYPSNYSWNEAAKACQPGYIDAAGNFHPYRSSNKMVPNTYDRGLAGYVWLLFLSVTIGLSCAVLLHMDQKA